MKCIVGIDLGNQFTKALVLDLNAHNCVPPAIVPDDKGNYFAHSRITWQSVPDDVNFDDGLRVFSQKLDWNFSGLRLYADDIKLLLGQKHDNSAVNAYLRRRLCVNIVEDEARGAARLHVESELNWLEYSTEELTAMFLNELKKRAIKEAGDQNSAESIAEDVVLAIPAYASQTVRNAYLDALHLSNFSSVLGLVDEGTAAAYYHVRTFQLKNFSLETEYHIVYDLGARSTTATLFSYTPSKKGTSVLDIESIGYDKNFGSELLEQSAYQLLFAKFLEMFGLDQSTVLPSKESSRLADTAEEAVLTLLEKSEYKVAFKYFYQGKSFNAVITRDELEANISDFSSHIIKPIEDALSNNLLGPRTIEDIKLVILYGHNARSPAIQKHLEIFLGSTDRISMTTMPDLAIAYGAVSIGLLMKVESMQPSSVKPATTPIMIVERINRNFEISLDESDTLTPIVSRGATVPITVELPLGEFKDSIEVRVYENGELLISYDFQDLEKTSQTLRCPGGTKEFIGTFEVDANKILSMTKLMIKCLDADEVCQVGEALSITAEGATSGPISIAIPQANFATVRPLNTSEKENSIKRLDYLESKGLEGIAFEKLVSLFDDAWNKLQDTSSEIWTAIESEMPEDLFEELDSILQDEFRYEYGTNEELRESYELY